jgi:predicted nucleic acid-binding Zn ribbon protein
MYNRDKDRYNNFQSLQEILSKIVNGSNLTKGIRETRAVQAWSQVTGTAIQRVTTSVYLRNGVLYVSLNSSIIRSELLMHKDRIMEALNREAGGKVVFDIVFR